MYHVANPGTNPTMPVMTGTQTAHAAIEEELETRFGKVRVQPANRIIFDRGLLGIPDNRVFTLAELPSDKLRQFKLLQSLDDTQLSFLTLPMDPKAPLIEPVDLEKACQDSGIDYAEMAVLLIVSVHRTPTEVKLSVNVRAPLIIDSERRQGVQYVFQHSRYQVQHMLG